MSNPSICSRETLRSGNLLSGTTGSDEPPPAAIRIWVCWVCCSPSAVTLWGGG